MAASRGRSSYHTLHLGPVSRAMSPRQSHWLEKFTVQAAIVATLAAGYFLLYPFVRPSDSQTAVAFLAVGGAGRVAGFAIGLLIFAAASALLTVSARPCGTILVAVLGTGAVAMRSPEFSTLLWLRQDNFGALFRLLIAETVLLGALLFVAVMVIRQARALAGRLTPRLAWHPSGSPKSPERPRDASRLAAGLGPWGRSFLSAALTLLVGLAAVAVLLQSAHRGQVLFALLASFAVAAWLANRLLPAPHVEAYLLAPLVAAVLFYALASVASYGSQPEAWANVPLYARALPIDWLTAGCGGAMLGCWIGQRMEDAKLLDQAEEQQKGD